MCLQSIISKLTTTVHLIDSRLVIVTERLNDRQERMEESIKLLHDSVRTLHDTLPSQHQDPPPPAQPLPAPLPEPPMAPQPTAHIDSTESDVQLPAPSQHASMSGLNGNCGRSASDVELLGAHEL